MSHRTLSALLCLVLLAAPATVSAQQDNTSASKQGKRDFRDEFEKFKKQTRKDYDDFRKKCLADYAKFVREAWKEFGAEPPIPVPEEPKVKPMLAPHADAQTASWFSRLFGKKSKSEKNAKAERKQLEQAKQQQEQPKPAVKKTSDQLTIEEIIAFRPAPPKPEPLSEVIEQPESRNEYYEFSVFGAKCRVRMGSDCRVNLKSISENDVADAIEQFQKGQFDNMLYDCLQERKRHNFSDWAYYQMLRALTDGFYGKHTNEGTLVMAFLYSQSGYKMRLAHDGTNLYMLVASPHTIYDKSYYFICADCDWYYLLDGPKNESLSVCQAAFPKESPLSLQITAVQDFGQSEGTERTITSEFNDEFSFTVKSNQNCIDFYGTYPSSYVDGNFMTRWAMYANTPLEKGLTAQLYPQIRQKIAGMSPLEAVQQLLWWVQTGLEYKFDEEVWGDDRAFFGEESIFYPYCDCEDRSILLSHLVRDLLGLDVVLVYYPGHLAMAVNFPEEVEGDYYLYQGRKFTVCDPTYIRAYVGETMPTVKDTPTTLILLER